MKDVLYNLPKVIDKFRNPTLPTTDNVEDSSDLQGEGSKIVIPSNTIDIHTRLEILLDLKISGRSDIFTEVSNFVDEMHKRGVIQNEQH